jgi:hypothetical protein
MKRLVQYIAAAFAAVLIAFGPVTAEAKTTQLKWQKTTVKGKAFNVAENWDLNPDCSVRAYPAAKVISAPTNGTAKVGRATFKMGSKFAKDPYYKCKSTTIKGTAVRYTPKPGFSGKDRLKLRVHFSTGDVHEIDIVITVR